MKSFYFFIFLLSIPIISYSQNPCPGVPTVTYSGKVYNTVLIGTQCWLQENLDVGTMIPGSSDQANNGTIEKYCYNNDPNNCSIYGGLYQWAEAVQYQNGATNTAFPNPAFTGNIQGICPTGWHMPTYSEIGTLATTVDDGNALKAIGQGVYSGAGTNTSGFSWLLSGTRASNGLFYDLGTNTSSFWTSTNENTMTSALNMSVHSSYSGINWYEMDRIDGFSIRCLNDESFLAVELSSFTAAAINNTVKLDWTTVTEVNSCSFEVEKKQTGSPDWQKMGEVKGAGNSNSPSTYTFFDKYLKAGKFDYRLKMIDNDGSYKYSSVVNVEVTAPKNFELSQNYPNPFNPTTKIEYTLPSSGLVKLQVFSVTGQIVKTLVDEHQDAGYYSVDFSGTDLAAGMCFYRLSVNSKTIVKKMLYLK